MKRILLFCVSCIIAMTTFAAELNIYASGLKAGGMSADKKVQVDYLLNAPATELEIHVLNADNSVAINLPVTDAALLTKGAHSLSIDVSSLAVGEYRWEVKAKAAAVTEYAKVTGNENRFNFYTPEGIAVDNSFESPYFGRVYVTESRDGLKTGDGRTTHQGVYIYDAMLEDVTNQGDNSYAGGVAWTESTAAIGGLVAAMSSPARISVDADGYVYICDNARISAEENYSALWRMDPANPSAAFKDVLDVTKRGTLFNRINDVVITGSGAERVLWVNDWTDAIIRFPIGNAEAYDVQPASADSVIILATHNILNGYNSLASDGRGGFWIFQYRGQLDAYPIVSHFNSKFERDYYIASGNNDTHITGGNKRGGGAVSPDGSLIVLNTEVSSVKTIVVLSVVYDENGKPAVTKFVDIPGYTNVEGFGFDVAGNLYAASASSEYFEAFALPKADNSFTTPAPSAQPIKVESTVVAVTGVTLDKASADVKVGEQLTLVATVIPDDATNKSVTWLSSDATVAAVTSEGVVSGLKAGTATITVKTADGEFTAECVITVTNVDVETIELDKTAATIYTGETLQLNATVTPANATNKNITWTTSDEAVATVDAEGLVTAVGVGTATITATTEDGAKTATCLVTIPEGAYPNIYAYGLKLESTNDGVTVGFNLNAPATEVKVLAYDAEGNEYVVATVSGAAAEYQTVALNTADLPAGTYTWAVYAAADLVTEDDPVLVRQYSSMSFASPRGVTIDNNTNSPYFGQIYVSDGGTAVENSGLYVFSPKLESDEQLYTTGWSGSKASPMRAMVGEDGLVYITDWSDNEGNIHIFNPANPTEEKLVFGGVFSGTAGIWNTEDNKFIHGSISGCYVTGTGAERVLYTFDEDYTPAEGNVMCMLRYDIGALETPWAAEPSAVVYNNADKFEQNGDSKILPSVAGGWWISQDRASDSQVIPALIHLSKDGVVDFNSAGAFGGRTRGAVAFNEDQTYCFSAADNAIRVNEVTWTDGVPAIKTLLGIPTTFGSQTGSSCYDIAVDRAGNVYASGDGKSLCIWAVYKDENSCVTPAAEGLTFEVEATGIESLEAGKSLKKGVYSITGQYLGEDTKNLQSGAYIINGKKVIR